jgi:lipid-A-disaccharide synthase-like uncharacterized protein
MILVIQHMLVFKQWKMIAAKADSLFPLANLITWITLGNGNKSTMEVEPARCCTSVNEHLQVSEQ